MSDAIITVENLGKKYRISHQGQRQRYTALRDIVAEKAKGFFKMLKTENLKSENKFRVSASQNLSVSSTEDFWALNDVSFEVKQGEVIGIIGRNGAGKSTLLKILSRITEPTTGRVTLRGRVASLLEVGTGFHPELTGRENIFLNGAILGMQRAEIKRKFDEIVAFAEVEKFLDTPVKRYSSGMYVRLAFAVAAHLDPEILVVDEVLAVGDAAFQNKCLGRMDKVAKEGRTVLFVSHNMATMQRLCSQGLFLERGKVLESGPIQHIIGRYLHNGGASACPKFDPSNRSGSGWAQVRDLRMVDDKSQPITTRPTDADLIFEIDLSVNSNQLNGATLMGLVLELMFYSEEGQPLTSVMSVDDGGIVLPESRGCRVRVRLPPPTFVPGKYHLRVFLGIPYLQHVDDIPDALLFEITPPIHPWRPYDLYAIRGHLCRKADWMLTNGINTLK